MLGEAEKHLTELTSVEKIYFVLFDEQAKNVFEEVLRGMKESKLAPGKS